MYSKETHKVPQTLRTPKKILNKETFLNLLDVDASLQTGARRAIAARMTSTDCESDVFRTWRTTYMQKTLPAAGSRPFRTQRPRGRPQPISFAHPRQKRRYGIVLLALQTQISEIDETYQFTSTVIGILVEHGHDSAIAPEAHHGARSPIERNARPVSLYFYLSACQDLPFVQQMALLLHSSGRMHGGEGGVEESQGFNDVSQL